MHKFIKFIVAILLPVSAANIHAEVEFDIEGATPGKWTMDLDAARLSEEERNQFTELSQQLENAEKRLSDRFKTKPGQNDENRKKYADMKSEVAGIKQKLDQH